MCQTDLTNGKFWWESPASWGKRAWHEAFVWNRHCKLFERKNEHCVSVELSCAFNAIRFWFLNLDTYTLIEKNIHNLVKDKIMHMKGFSHI